MMRISFALAAWIAFCLFAAPCPSAAAMEGGMTSTMEVINSAVMEARGYYLTSTLEQSGRNYSGDLAPTQAFELIRPNMEAITIGRLYTSCTCVQLSVDKRTFAKGERAIFELRNVRLTPQQGQVYAIYVQLTRPMRVTLRYDTFLQSSQFVIQPAAPAPAEPAGEPVEIAAAGEETPDGEAEVVAATGQEEVGTGAETPSVTAAPAAAEETEEAAPTREEDGAVTPPEHQRVSVITLGVEDLGRSRTFYEALGWKAVRAGKYDGIVFFQLNGQVLALYPLSELLKDQGREGAETGSGGITLSINVTKREEVESLHEAFVKAGGTSLKKPTETPWGSLTCYVADPDNHPWEISWLPRFQLNDEGELWLP